MGIQALIGLGSNLGDRKGHLDAAVASLSEVAGVVVEAVSSYHETVPVGGPSGQGSFLNAALRIETKLDPFDLLHLLQSLENQAGRVRAERWGERPLDLDILQYGDRVLDTRDKPERGRGREAGELIVPHPRMALRRFVLATLVEVAAETVEPLTGRTVADLLANLDRRPSYLAIHDPIDSFSPELVGHLVAELPASLLFDKQDAATVGGKSLLDHFATLGQNDDAPPNERGPGGREKDHWLLSDVWLDAFYASDPVLEPERTKSRETFLQRRRLILTPSFVVARQGARHRFRRSSPVWRGVPELGDVPILEVDPGDPGAVIAEVLAACAATRAGG